MNSVGPCSSSTSRQIAAVTGRRARLVGRGPGAAALLRHPLLEVVDVDGAAALAGDLAGEVDREAERVVQEEGIGAAHVAAVDEVVEHVDAALQRGAERLLLAADHLLDGLAVGDDLRVRRAHHVDRGVDHRAAARDHARRACTRAGPPGG